MLRNLITIIFFALPLPLAAQTGDPTIDFSGDPDMAAAMTNAIQTLPLFLRNATDDEGLGAPSALVKVSFDVANGTEVIWVGPFADYGDGQMAGILANQPNFMPDLNAGDPVRFSADMVRDWAITMPDGLLWGHYTTRKIVTTLPADQAGAIQAALSPTPVPSDWK